MAAQVVALYLACLWKMAQAANLTFVSVQTGANLTLRCSYEHNVPARRVWYIQSLGQKPRLISSYYKIGGHSTFYDEFENNPRFTLDTENGKNHLTITDLRTLDSATYYCISCDTYTFEYTEGITVSVKGSGLKIPTLVHQSASETIQPGGSVTLNCTVHTGSCDGEHSVYWFKTSEESHPGLIYTHGGRTDQCERESNTHTCVYNLLMKSLNVSHAGTYYCAVVSCGYILFGNKTQLHFEDRGDSPLLVYVLSAALTFTYILVVLLSVSMYKMKKSSSFPTPERQAGFSAATTANAEGFQDADELHYAALSVNRRDRSRGQRNSSTTECVYSRVQQ